MSEISEKVNFWIKYFGHSDADKRRRSHPVVLSNFDLTKEETGPCWTRCEINAFVDAFRTTTKTVAEIQLRWVFRDEAARTSRASVGATAAATAASSSSARSGFGDDDSIRALFRMAVGIERILLPQNGFDAAHAGWLAEGLGSEACRTVELRIQANCLDDAGAVVLAERGLMHNRTLKCLALNYNDIGDAGAIALAKVLGSKDAAPLTELHLTSNRIGSRGFKAIAAALKRNNTLQYLFLSDNPRVKAAGLAALEDALKHCNYALKIARYHFSDKPASPRQRRLDCLCKRNVSVQKTIEQFNASVADGWPLPASVAPRALEKVADKPDLLYQMLKTQPFLLSVLQNNGQAQEQEEKEEDRKQSPSRKRRRISY